LPMSEARLLPTPVERAFKDKSPPGSEKPGFFHHAHLPNRVKIFRLCGLIRS